MTLTPTLTLTPNPNPNPNQGGVEEELSKIAPVLEAAKAAVGGTPQTEPPQPQPQPYPYP